MKVITLTQPWATLVAIGAKRIETRSWATSYRGPLVIHAAKGLGPVGGNIGLAELCEDEPFDSVLKKWWWDRYIAGGRTDPRGIPLVLPRGAIIATCDLVGCEQIGYEWTNNQQVMYTGRWGRAYAGHRLTPQERAFGDYTPGRFAWLLANVKPLPEPIPAKGALGLWEFAMPQSPADPLS